MGVTGLWRLIDASGKPVPLESLEGKVLAIDISIWIYQVIQGYQDGRGNAVPNAHLLGLFNRICKLLYFKIKPVFVFDGGVPLLKKDTIAARKRQKAVAAGKAEELKNDLLLNLMKHSLVKGILSNKVLATMPVPSTSKTSVKSNALNDMFKLPAAPELDPESDTESSEDESPRKNSKWRGNIHTVDVTTEEFKSLPADVRYDILTDLKETRKQNSWGRLHEIPEESDQFATYQMQRLLKRRKVQEFLESAEQEMGGKNLTLEELERLMSEQGVDTKSRDLQYRIASDATTRIIYIDNSKSKTGNREDSGISQESIQPSCSKNSTNELTTIPEDSSVVENIEEYDLDDAEDWDSDVELIESVHSAPKAFFGKTTKNPAVAYMVENSELSQDQIMALIEQSKETIKKLKAAERAKRNRTDGKAAVKTFEEFQKDFDFREFIGIKEEDICQEISSDDNDFYEQNHNETKDASTVDSSMGVLNSDSESDDFVEVQEVAIPKLKSEKKMEIVIKADRSIDDDDDLFADVFEAKIEDKSISSELSNSRGEIIENGAMEHRKEDDRKISLTSETPENGGTIDDEIGTENVSGFAEASATVEGESMQLNTSISSAAQETLDKGEASSANQSMSPKRTSDSPIQTDPRNFPTNQRHADEHRDSTSTIEVSPNYKVKSKPPIETPPSQVRESFINISPDKPSSRISSIITRLDTEKPHLLSQISKITSKDNELQELESQLSMENQELKQSIGKLDRQSTEITEQMRLDAQELLRLFGIPYVVAPQEAEAQCAYLESINLTDGSITDDSDIWLFGGRCVYRNFFNSAKRVMQYLAKDIERQFRLTRQQMIQMALLVGSDYTLGIPGIGPVTALEVIASFPSQGDDLLRGLTNFSTWVRGGRVVGPGRATLRNKLKNIVVDRGFPSQSVVQAYLFPSVDESKETFSWGKPNVVLLGDYTREKFGWTRGKFDEIMGPVIKKMEEKGQKNLLGYFNVKHIPKDIGEGISKRVMKAVQRMGKGGEDDEESDGVVKKKRRRVKKSKDDNDKDEGMKDVAKEEVPRVGTDGISGNADNEEVQREIKGRKLVKTVKEIIPQREKDKKNALDKKLRAIEVFRKSRKKPGKTKGKVSVKRNVVQEAKLSESSDSD